MVQIIRAESAAVVTRGWGRVGEMRRTWLRVQFHLCQNKFWRSVAQHGDCV